MKTLSKDTVIDFKDKIDEKKNDVEFTVSKILNTQKSDSEFSDTKFDAINEQCRYDYENEKYLMFFESIDKRANTMSSIPDDTSLGNDNRELLQTDLKIPHDFGISIIDI